LTHSAQITYQIVTYCLLLSALVSSWCFLFIPVTHRTRDPVCTWW